MASFSTPTTVTDVLLGQQLVIAADKFVKVFSTGVAVAAPYQFPAASTGLTTASITAHAGGGQGSATLLTTEFNIVTVCATAADSVKLPTATPFTQFIITNNGAAALAVFPATSGTINSGSANASVTVAVGATLILVGSTTVNWNTSYPSTIYYYDNATTLRKKTVYEDAGAIANASQFLINVTNTIGGTNGVVPSSYTLYINPNRIESYTNYNQFLTGASGVTYNNVTAHAGGGQVTSTDPSLLTANQNFTIVTIVATANDSITLPAATVGSYFAVTNLGANNLSVYAFTSGTINSGSTNGYVTVNPNTQTIFTGSSTTNWKSSSPAVTKIIFDATGTGDEVLNITQTVAQLNTAIDEVIAGNSQTGVIFPVLQNQAATVTLTPAESGATVLFDSAAGIVYTLPAATVANTGVNYTFIVNTSITSNSATVSAASSADLMYGQIAVSKSGAFTMFAANGSSNYNVEMNGTTTGGLIGTEFTVICGGLNKWIVNGNAIGSGTIATPFV